MYSEMLREELENMPIDLLNFTLYPEMQKKVRQEVRPFLRKLSIQAHSDTLDVVHKMLHKIEIKTMKEEGDDGYDTEHTADMTSDDSEEEEAT